LKVEHSGGLVPGGSDEEITIHGDADCLELKAGRQLTVGQGAVPGARHRGGDLTQLEVPVWRHGSVRSKAYEGAGGGERQAQAHVCGSGAGAPCDEGPNRKKALKPPEKRQAVKYMQDTHGLSVVRSCQYASLARSVYYREPLAWRVRDAEIIDALDALIEGYPRWGFWKCMARLK
jgi:hypothetical protein